MRVEQGDYRGVGLPVRLSATPGQAGPPPPRFAEHTDEVLDEAGIGPDERERLRSSGVLPGRR